MRKTTITHTIGAEGVCCLCTTPAEELPEDAITVTVSHAYVLDTHGTAHTVYCLDVDGSVHKTEAHKLMGVTPAEAAQADVHPVHECITRAAERNTLAEVA